MRETARGAGATTFSAQSCAGGSAEYSDLHVTDHGWFGLADLMIFHDISRGYVGFP